MKLGRAKLPKASGLPWSSWQIDVTAQADRLQTDLANVRDDAPQAVVEAIEGHIVKARDIAVGKLKPPNRLFDWLSGLSVEAAWRELQRAQEDMLALRPASELAGEAHYFDMLAARRPDPELQKVTHAWVSGSSDVDPAVAKVILAHAHLETNTAHQSIRRAAQPDPRMVRDAHRPCLFVVGGRGYHR